MEPPDPDVARSHAHGTLSDDYVKPTSKAGPAKGTAAFPDRSDIKHMTCEGCCIPLQWMRDLDFDTQSPTRKLQKAAGRYAAAVGNSVHTDDNHRHGQNHGQRQQPILITVEESDVADPTTVGVSQPETSQEKPIDEAEANADDLLGRSPPTRLIIGPQMTELSFRTSLQSVHDIEIFLQFISTTTDGLYTNLLMQTPTQQTEILRQIERLTNSAQQARRALAIGEIAVEAHQVSTKLKTTFREFQTPLNYSHAAWMKGSSKRGQMRVLLPVGTVVQIFRNAVYEAYANDEGIVTDLQNLTNSTAYHIKNGQLYRKELNDVFPGKVAMKCIEMRLDYEQVMERMQFQSIGIPKDESGEDGQDENDNKHNRTMHRKRVMEVCLTWAEFLLKEKRRQMNIEDRTIWPTLPWCPRDVLSMPVVIWIKINKRR